MILTQQQLRVMCEICCKVLDTAARQCLTPLSAHSLHVSVSNFTVLKCEETLTFISSGLWPLNPQSTEVQNVRSNAAPGLLQEIHKVNGPTLWLVLHIINDTTDQCKRL